ncbi:hypothetical protein ABPG75_000768 [Micractinium tetrahymenae]
MAVLLEQSGLPPGPSKLELSFSLDDPAFASDHFRMYDFKVKRCPRARPHDWTACPFAHPGEKAKRRDPRRYRYSGTACPDFRKTGVCRRGDACPYSHGVFECWLHPSRYRTQMCTDGPSCRRRVCFFAHFEHELRRAEEYPPLLNQQLHAGLVADARALQQQQLAQALSGILGGSAPSLPGGAPTTLEPLMSMQLLKTLSQGTPNALLDSTPTTPTSIAGLSPNSAAAAAAGAAGLNDSSKLLLQLQLIQQQQAGGAAAVAAAAGLHTAVSDASQQSGSSPGGSPRLMVAAAAELLGTPTHAAADAARQGSPPVLVAGADEASQLARLIQQQQAAQQAQQAAQAAAVAGGIDPALLAALQNLGLGGQPEGAAGLDAAGLGINSLSRRSIDNSALTRQFSQPQGTGAAAADNYLAAAAAALASGTAVGGLNTAGAGAGAAPAPAVVLPGSLPTPSFMAAAAAALARAQPSSPSVPAPVDDDRTLSLDHILAELPRSASQVNLPAQ